MPPAAEWGPDPIPRVPGPPQNVRPAVELYAELLLRAGKANEALEQFRVSLLRTPNRAASLAGAARAAEGAGDVAAAAEYRDALAKITH